MIKEMEPVTTLIDRVEEEMPEADDGKKVRRLTEMIFSGMPQDFLPETLSVKELAWECDCSEERLEKILMTIGKSDLEEIIREDGEAELVCQFCLKKYRFDKAHLERILDSIK